MHGLSKHVIVTDEEEEEDDDEEMEGDAEEQGEGEDAAEKVLDQSAQAHIRMTCERVI